MCCPFTCDDAQVVCLTDREEIALEYKRMYADVEHNAYGRCLHCFRIKQSRVLNLTLDLCPILFCHSPTVLCDIDVLAIVDKRCIALQYRLQCVRSCPVSNGMRVNAQTHSCTCLRHNQALVEYFVAAIA